MSPSTYAPTFLYVTLVLTLVKCMCYLPETYKKIIKGNHGALLSLFVSIIGAYWFGHRPIDGVYMGDTPTYANAFNAMKGWPFFGPPASGTEWIWTKLMYASSQAADVEGFFTLVAIGYFGFTLWACIRLMPNDVWGAMLFNLATFSFYSYGTNGIRNGLACSIALLAISYVCVPKFRNMLIGGLLAFLAINIHKTTMLPLFMLLLSITFVRNFKIAYVFWILSILISLVAGGAVASFFSGLGFDDRLSYFSDTQHVNQFSHSGFRWDFLIYSMMPIVLGYYVIFVKNIRDRVYMILLNTYTLSNAFWIMVIRASFSNRFAYLSWFMYGMVLAYPCLRLNIWKNKQGVAAALIMFAQIAFKWVMDMIYYG